MPTTCVVFGCNNRHSKGCSFSFYHFLTYLERRRCWVAFVGRQNPAGTTWQPGKDDRLCSDHFISKKKSDIPINPDYIPSVNIKIKLPKAQASSEKSLARFERAQRHSSTSEQTHRALKLEREANFALTWAVCKAVEHDHGAYYKNTSPSAQEQPCTRGSGVEILSTQNRSSSPAVPAEVGKNFIFAQLITSVL